MATRWRTRVGITALVLGGALGVLAWQQWPAWQAWWCLRGLARADEADRPAWVERVAALGEPALPGLLDLLGDGEDAHAAAAGAALERLGLAWGPGDPRTVALAERLARAEG